MGGNMVRLISNKTDIFTVFSVLKHWNSIYI
jgi:hypothetical protein